ncbi:MAG: hypothetical protein CFE41_17060 [Burkholderiales bacterium PBB2]|nr:MAG: hypothetical protein CFE41_17060 [Burkholderiales bacterium PBB2]
MADTVRHLPARWEILPAARGEAGLHNSGVPRLILIVLGLSLLSWAVAPRMGMALLLLCGVLVSVHVLRLAHRDPSDSTAAGDERAGEEKPPKP